MKTADQQSTKMSFYCNTAAPTPALVSGTVDFILLQRRSVSTLMLSIDINIIAVRKRQCADRV